MAHSNVQRIYIYLSRRAIVNKITASISIPIQSFNNPTRDLNRAEADSTFEFEISPPPLWPLFSAIISDLSSESRCTNPMHRNSNVQKIFQPTRKSSICSRGEWAQGPNETDRIVVHDDENPPALLLDVSNWKTVRLEDWETRDTRIQRSSNFAVTRSKEREGEEEGREKHLYVVS